MLVHHTYNLVFDPRAGENLHKNELINIVKFEIKPKSHAWWHGPVNPSQEAEAERSQVQNHPGQLTETLSQNKTLKKDISQGVVLG